MRSNTPSLTGMFGTIAVDPLSLLRGVEVSARAPACRPKRRRPITAAIGTACNRRGQVRVPVALVPAARQRGRGLEEHAWIEGASRPVSPPTNGPPAEVPLSWRPLTHRSDRRSASSHAHVFDLGTRLGTYFGDVALNRVSSRSATRARLGDSGFEVYAGRSQRIVSVQRPNPTGDPPARARGPACSAVHRWKLRHALSRRGGVRRRCHCRARS
jgi:hypothetical protein